MRAPFAPSMTIFKSPSVSVWILPSLVTDTGVKIGGLSPPPPQAPAHTNTSAGIQPARQPAPLRLIVPRYHRGGPTIKLPRSGQVSPASGPSPEASLESPNDVTSEKPMYWWQVTSMSENDCLFAKSM